jgi:hypothetical protein
MRLRCTTIIMHYIHRQPLTEDDVTRFKSGALLEERIGLGALHQVYGKSRCPDGSGPLEYLSVATDCKFRTREVPIGLHELATRTAQGQRRMFTLKPRVAFEPAEDLKKEMMASYAEDNYYFFEEYVDSMMGPSQSALIEW